MSIRKTLLYTAASLVWLASTGLTASAVSPPPYVARGVLTPPQIPGTFGLVSDIVFADPATHLLYLSDDANAQVDVWSTRTGAFVGAMRGGFTGEEGFPSTFDQLGPAGVLVDDLGQLWAGNGDGTVKVGHAVAPFTETDSIVTGSTNRADELAYDPVHHVIIVTNPSEAQPYVTLINAIPDAHGHHGVLAHEAIPGAGVDSVEQPAWDPVSERFLVSVRETGDYPGGEFAVIDPNPKAPRLQSVFPMDRSCNPAGMAIGPGDEMLLGCDSAPPVIVNRSTGAIVASLDGHSACCADEVWFNPADGRYYAAEIGSAALAPAVMVIDAHTHAFVTDISIADTSGAFHAVAAAYRDSQVFAPEGDGVHVFTR